MVSQEPRVSPRQSNESERISKSLRELQEREEEYYNTLPQSDAAGWKSCPRTSSART